MVDALLCLCVGPLVAVGIAIDVHKELQRRRIRRARRGR